MDLVQAPRFLLHLKSTIRKYLVTFQAMMLILLGVSSIVPLDKDELVCSIQNTMTTSFEPMLQWSNGPPPIWISDEDSNNIFVLNPKLTSVITYKWYFYPIPTIMQIFWRHVLRKYKYFNVNIMNVHINKILYFPNFCNEKLIFYCV